MSRIVACGWLCWHCESSTSGASIVHSCSTFSFWNSIGNTRTPRSRNTFILSENISLRLCTSKGKCRSLRAQTARCTCWVSPAPTERVNWGGKTPRGRAPHSGHVVAQSSWPGFAHIGESWKVAVILVL